MFSNNLLMAAAGGGDAGYVIENSVMLDRGSSNCFTWAGTGQSQTTYTFSMWVKFASLSTGWQGLVGSGTSSTDFFSFRYRLNQLEWGTYASGWYGYHETTQYLRDPSAWYHIVTAVDTTNATAGNRQKTWINGELITAFDSATNYTSSYATDINQTIGLGCSSARAGGLPGDYLDAYVAEFHYLDGTAGVASDFGENSDGVWIPIDLTEHSLSYGTNGAHLNFENGSDLGEDTSGNGNDWTVSANVPTQTTDTPTNDADNDIGNYCTWNPLDGNEGKNVFSNGNLTNTSSTSSSNVGRAFFNFEAPTSGKYYFEITIDTLGVNPVGFALFPDGSGKAYKATGWPSSYAFINLKEYPDSPPSLNNVNYAGADRSQVSYGNSTAFAASDVLGVAWDADNGLLFFSKNDSWFDGDGTDSSATVKAEIEAGTSGSDAFDTSQCGIGDADYQQIMGIWCNSISSFAHTVNFGQSDFTYTPPSGFLSLCTANMPTPAIPDPTEHHQVELVSHDGSSTAFTCNWDADVYDTLFIIKNRDSVEKWYWVDGLNGYNKYTSSDQNTAQTTDANVVTVSGTTITLGSTLAADNYVVECHKAGLAGGASNSDGTITSTVSANITSGFSIILWTGTQANATIGHGLDSAPEFTTGFKILGGEGRWGQHIGLTSGVNSIRIDTTGAQVSGSTQWNSTFPSSTVISLGSSNATNFSGAMMMYAWHGVEGYSAFGSYEGNSNEDGPMVLTNMKPTLIMLKPIDAVENWTIWDTQRAPYNVSGARLYPNSTVAEEGTVDLDILSNGFKLRNAGGNQNPSSTVVYSTWGGRPIQGTGDGSTSQGRAR